jgi:tetratricopeptide (TPR) repeat protein/cellulose biosynthesis protein BcsQ
MERTMFVVTFYSYKGGVGRTLALVNCAFRLAQEGKKVFILDFDLEAPGVDAFRPCGNGESRQGIVEYVSRFTSQGSVEALDDYVYRVDAEQTARGTIHFMPAGRKDEEYQSLLSKLDWKHFYSRQKGYLFVENLKAAIERRYAPDYVLVDSRTGLTDISGICTLQLPNLVVLLFNLNNQNVTGISRIYRSIRENRINRDIKTLLVASPIPDMPDYIKVRKERIAFAQAKTGADEINLILPFDPFVAFEETVLPGGDQGTYLAKSYDRLTRMIRSENKLDVSTMLERARKLEDEGSIDLADLKYLELTQAHPNELKALVQYARFLRIRGNSDAVKYLERARKLDPKDQSLLGQLIRTQMTVGQISDVAQYLDEFLTSSKDAEELESMAELFSKKGQTDAAIRFYERAIELADEPEVGHHLGLGNIYMGMNRLDLAVQQYQVAIGMAPSCLQAVYNYAYAMSLLGDSRAEEFFRDAVELYEREDLDDYDDKANLYQAMSQAYAALSEHEKAQEFRGKAIKIAAAGPSDRLVFSSIQYKLIPARQFIEETKYLATRARPI